jgi:hypothetical protein
VVAFPNSKNKNLRRSEALKLESLSEFLERLMKLMVLLKASIRTVETHPITEKSAGW